MPRGDALSWFPASRIGTSLPMRRSGLPATGLPASPCVSVRFLAFAARRSVSTAASELTRLRAKRQQTQFPGRLFRWALGGRQIEVHVVPCAVSEPLYDKCSTLINPAVRRDGWAKSVLSEPNADVYAAGGTPKSVDAMVTQLGGKALKRDLWWCGSGRTWRSLSKYITSEPLATASAVAPDTIAVTDAHGELGQRFSRVVHATPYAYKAMGREAWIEWMMVYYQRAFQAAFAFKPGETVSRRRRRQRTGQRGLKALPPTGTVVVAPLVGSGACGAPIEAATRAAARAALMWLRAPIEALRHPGDVEEASSSRETAPSATLVLTTTDVAAGRLVAEMLQGAVEASYAPSASDETAKQHLVEALVLEGDDALRYLKRWA